MRMTLINKLGSYFSFGPQFSFATIPPSRGANSKMNLVDKVFEHVIEKFVGLCSYDQSTIDAGGGTLANHECRRSANGFGFRFTHSLPDILFVFTVLNAPTEGRRVDTRFLGILNQLYEV